jgi:hypothetical protein
MKHYFGKNALFALLVTTLIGTTLGCTASPEEPSLVRIEITSKPTKLVYEYGETLDIEGLLVSGIYSDGVIKRENVSTKNILNYANCTSVVAGPHSITVKIGNCTNAFSITVKPATLQYIRIESLPSKVNYALGETLNTDNLQVEATYKDGSSSRELVNISNLSPQSAVALGQQTITVSVNGVNVTADGITTATFEITVTNAALQSIEIDAMPTRIVYNYGEVLDTSGLTVTKTYTDGTTDPQVSVTDNQIAGNTYDPTQMGQQNVTLTVTIDNKSDIATFTVTVNEALASIIVATPPTKLDYTQGEVLDLSGLTIEVTYTDSPPDRKAKYDIGKYLIASLGTTQPLYGVPVKIDENTTVTKDCMVTITSNYDHTATSLGARYVRVTMIIGGRSDNAQFNIFVKARETITVSLDDQIAVSPANIVLSKSNPSLDQTLAISDPSGSYTDYAWYLNDKLAPVSMFNTYTLRATECRLGPNFLTVEVKTSTGVYYAKEIAFTVVQ